MMNKIDAYLLRNGSALIGCLIGAAFVDFVTGSPIAAISGLSLTMLVASK